MKSWEILKVSLLSLVFLDILQFSFLKPLNNDDPESENEIGKHVSDLSLEDKEHRSNYAQQMLSFMNRSVDPCEDFYEYSCGNWKNVIVERSTTHKRNNMYDITFKIAENMEEILQRPSDSINPDVKSEFEMVQKFYKSCLDADLMKPIDSTEYLTEINKIGGFPALDDNWNATNFSWFNMTSHLMNYGIASLIREEILPYHPFPPFFKIPELGYGFVVHSDNIKTNTSTGYIFNANKMRKYLTAYGVQEPKLSETIEGVFEFLREYVDLSEEIEDDLGVCRAMESIFGNVFFNQWDNYMEIVWKGKDLKMERRNYPCHKFYIEIDKLCEKHKAAVANYLAMAFLHKMDAELTAKKFQKDYCVSHTVEMAPYLMDELYLEGCSFLRNYRYSQRCKLFCGDYQVN